MHRQQYSMTENDKERFYANIGESIKAARTKAKLSQAELAKNISMSRASVVNIEKGRQHPPLHLIWTLADILKVPLIKLIPDFQLSDNEINPFFEKAMEKTTQLGFIHEESAEKISSFISKS